MIGLPAGTRVRLAAGETDMRKGIISADRCLPSSSQGCSVSAYQNPSPSFTVRSRRPIVDSVRLRTQLEPPDDDGSQSYGGGEVGGKLVVAGGDAAPVLEPTEHAFDQVAQLVGVRIERVQVAAGRVIWE